MPSHHLSLIFMGMKKKKFEFYIEFHGDSTKKEKKSFELFILKLGELVILVNYDLVI